MPRPTRRSGRDMKPDLAVHAERLGAGADVGDHLGRAHEDEHGDDGAPLRALAHEVDDEGRGHHELRDAVERGVEERAGRGGPGAGARDRSVERVAERRDDADDERPDEVAGDDERQGRPPAAAGRCSVIMSAVKPRRARTTPMRKNPRRAPSV